MAEGVGWFGATPGPARNPAGLAGGRTDRSSVAPGSLGPGSHGIWGRRFRG